MRVNPNMALWRGDSGAFRFEWNIAFGMQLPVHFDAVAGNADGDILNRSVGSSKHILIQDIGQRVRADGNLGEVDSEREGLDVVEHGEARALGGQDQAMQLVNVDSDLVSEVVHDVAHVHLDSRRFAPLLLRDLGKTRAACGDASYRNEEQYDERDAIHGSPP